MPRAIDHELNAFVAAVDETAQERFGCTVHLIVLLDPLGGIRSASRLSREEMIAWMRAHIEQIEAEIELEKSTR